MKSEIKLLLKTWNYDILEYLWKYKAMKEVVLEITSYGTVHGLQLTFRGQFMG